VEEINCVSLRYKLPDINFLCINSVFVLVVYRPIIISDIRGFVLPITTTIYKYCRISTAEVEYDGMYISGTTILRCCEGSFRIKYSYYYYMCSLSMEPGRH
jgi:hypothetical protein